MTISGLGQIRLVLFALYSLPLLLLVYPVIGNHVGPDPGRYVVELLCDTASTFLLLTLALSRGVRIW